MRSLLDQGFCFLERCSGYKRDAENPRWGETFLRFMLVSPFLILICFGFVAFNLAVGDVEASRWLVPVVTIGVLIAFLPVLAKEKRTSKDLMAAVALSAAFLALIVSYSKMVEDTPIQRMTATFRAIRPGMTRPEIDEVVRREFPGLRTSVIMDGSNSIILGPLNPEDGKGTINVTMKNGSVVAKRYHPFD